MSEFREPWKGRDQGESAPEYIRHSEIFDAEGCIVCGHCQCKDGSVGKIPLDVKHRDRILAAVNFCRNIPTEWLEKHVVMAGDDGDPLQFRGMMAVGVKETSE